VPCIGAVPIIGEPFKFTENKNTKTNLMVFLKPNIIKSADQIEEITDRKYIDIKKLYEHPLEGGTILFPQKQKQLPANLQPGLKKLDAPAPATL